LAKASELRGLTVEELQQQLEERREDLFQLRIQNATHQLENYAQLSANRREVARIMTVLTEKVRADDDAGENKETED
jgi:large subunit ribosomal protein L29